jgi:hypothetical protein
LRDKYLPTRSQDCWKNWISSVVKL